MPSVDVKLITIEALRVRAIKDQQVAALVDSIREVGLLHPLVVHRTEAGYGLIAGAHRLEACKRLGHSEIEVTIVDLDELHRTIAECDENLAGTNLSPAERAEITFRRKVAYEQLHPETRLGENRVRQVGEATRFTADTAAASGASERTVQRDAERGAKIVPAALALVSGTPSDLGTVLDDLKDTPPGQQVRRAHEHLAGPIIKISRPHMVTVPSVPFTIRITGEEPPEPKNPPAALLACRLQPGGESRSRRGRADGDAHPATHPALAGADLAGSRGGKRGRGAIGAEVWQRLGADVSDADAARLVRWGGRSRTAASPSSSGGIYDLELRPVPGRFACDAHLQRGLMASSKGMRAMAAALLFPDLEKLKRKAAAVLQ